MKSFATLILFAALMFMSLPLFAQAPVASATPAAVVAAPASGDSAPFFAQVLEAIQKMGGLPTLLKVSTVILLLVASMKVSFLNDLIWSKLGPYKSLAGTALGLIAGLVGLFGGGAPVTIASVFAYLGAGVGATGLHELLDDIKALPGIGPVYLSIISMIESVLGGAKKPDVAA